MDISYDVFLSAFLSKVTEYDFATLSDSLRTGIVDGYMRRALIDFSDVCEYDFESSADDTRRLFSDIDISQRDLIEITDIVSDGMVVQWLRPYVYRIENLELTMSTKDFTTFSSANLLSSITDTYQKANRQFINRCREYSYRHGDLTVLHL